MAWVMSASEIEALGPRETRVALQLSLLLLVALSVAKPLAALPWVGTVLLSLIAVGQLWVPLWRVESRGLSMAALGLHLQGWRSELGWALLLALIFFPLYGLGFDLYVRSAHDWVVFQLGAQWGAWVPELQFAPRWPREPAVLLRVAERVATHTLAVALPEECFYRGYVQPLLQVWWPAKRRVLGVAMGRAVLVASLLFALGHVAGEWNPLRLAPFFPALIFAWQRNRGGSLLGCIVFHALCNLYGEFLFSLYR